MKKLVGIVVVALSVSIISCQEDGDLLSQTEGLGEKSAQIVINEISVDNAVADINFESDFFIGAEGMMNGMNGSGMNWGSNNSMHYMMGQHPNFTMHGEQGQSPDSMVINYGMGTQLNNGRAMSGSMIINTSEEPNGDGFMRKITYDNFSVDSMSITGMTTMYISGDHQSGGTHSLIGDLIITLPDGTTIHRESEIMREWNDGGETNLDQTDDVMKVTGHVINTINESGIETIYRKDIIEPLIKASGCRYFSQGIIELSQGGNVIAALDYGNGECDDVAVLTKDGEEPVEIVLSKNDHCSNNQGAGAGMGHADQQGAGNGMGMGHGTTTGNGPEASGGNGMGQGTTNGPEASGGMGQGHGSGHGNG